METIANVAMTQTQPPVEFLEAPPPPGTDDYYFDFWLGWHKSLPGVVDHIIDWTGACMSRHSPSSCLILAGNSGCGKSHLAKLVCKSVQRMTSVMVSEQGLLDNLRKAYSQGKTTGDVLDQYASADLLIFDDLGASRGNQDWLDTIYLTLFDTDQAYLVTTNLLSADEFGKHPFAERIGMRTASRLSEKRGDSSNFVDMFDVPDIRPHLRKLGLR